MIKSKTAGNILSKVFIASSNQIITDRFSEKSVEAVCNGSCNGKCSGRFMDDELHNISEHSFFNAS